MGERDAPQHGREELQRMRGELCGFIDRTPNILQQDFVTHGYSIDVGAVGNAVFADQFGTLYSGDVAALVDDALFYKFIKAARTYIDTPDEATRRGIANASFVPYVEYLLNTPRTSEEQAMISAVGYQEMDEETKASSLRGIELLYGGVLDDMPFFQFYNPTFSPEYKDYFLSQIRDDLLHAYEPNPESDTPLFDMFKEGIVKGFVNLMAIPQDVIRDDLPEPNYKWKDFPSVDNPETDDFNNQINATVREYLEGYNEKEKKIFMLLWGLGDGISRTKAEIAKEVGITMDEVTQFEQDFFSKK